MPLIKSFHLFFVSVLLICTITAQGQTYVKGSLYVKAKKGYSIDDISYSFSTSGLTIKYGIISLTNPFSGYNETLDHTYKLNFSEIIDPDSVIKALAAFNFVEFSEKIPVHRLSYTPDDLLPNQWNLLKINAPEGWDKTKGSIDISIAIIDNGVRITHEDLQANIWVNLKEIPDNFLDDDLNGYIDDVRGYDVADLDNNPSPPASALNTSPFVHGTHVAGIASAATDNTLGIASLGFNTLIMPVKCTSDASDGNNLDNAFDGIIYAMRAGANVINMSFGTEDKSLTGQNIINAAHDLGIILIAAAGNENVETTMYPAGYEHVISVGSTDQNDKKSSFSNFGSTLDVMAPGSSILSTLAGTDVSFGYLSGTSMASPHVAALAALVLSVNPDYTPEQVEQVIEEGCDNIEELNPDYIGQLGRGRINAAKTLAKVEESAIEEVEENKLKIYPNPTTGIFKVAVGVTEKNGKQLRISNVLGQTLYEEPLNIMKTKNTIRFDLTGYASGIYFIQLYDEYMVYDVKKVIVQ